MSDLNLATAQDLGQENEVNLCDSCCNIQPSCDADNLIFGTGKGEDNIIACSKYTPIELRHPKHEGMAI